MGQVLETQAMTTQSLETDESGRLVIPAEMLGDARPHARFVVQTIGRSITIQPEGAASSTSKPTLTPEEWLKEWRELAEDVGKAWPVGKTAAEVISEMRR